MALRQRASMLVANVLAGVVMATSPGIAFAADEAPSPEALRRHVELLGSDALEGRGTGTRGDRAAAAYLAAELARLKLCPLGDDGTFQQAVPVHVTRALPQSDLTLCTSCETRHLELVADYELFAGGFQTYIARPAPLVFVGFGIVAPEYDYNDYQGIDVAGKVVVFLAGEPPSRDVSFFAGERSTVYSSPEIKQRIAISRGARGSILVGSPQETRWSDWAWVNRQFAAGDLTLAYAVPKQFSAVVHPRVAQLLFCGSRYSLDQVQSMAASHTMHSFPLGSALWFHGVFAEKDVRAANVVAKISGRDPRLAGSYVLLSAHHDHLGVSTPVNGDAIYNGVNDNAVGVAALLEIARLLAAAPPRRSIVVLFTTGEEHGLLGAGYYCDHAAAPLSATVADINIDGIATFDSFHDVIGVGAELSTLGATLRQVAGALGLAVATMPAPLDAATPFAQSDQVAFAEAGLPAILVVEGFDLVHHSRDDALQHAAAWFRNVYHTPFDDLSQPLDFTAAAQHVRVLLALTRAVADAADAPEWLSGVPYANARRLAVLEQR